MRRRRRWFVHLGDVREFSLKSPVQDSSVMLHHSTTLVSRHFNLVRATTAIEHVPRTSTLRTCSLSSLIPSSPVRMFSRVWSKSFLAVATIGTFVVCRSRRASSRPMPRDAGLTSAQGCMLASMLVLCTCEAHHGSGGIKNIYITIISMLLAAMTICLFLWRRLSFDPGDEHGACSEMDFCLGRASSPGKYCLKQSATTIHRTINMQ